VPPICAKEGLPMWSTGPRIKANASIIKKTGIQGQARMKYKKDPERAVQLYLRLLPIKG